MNKPRLTALKVPSIKLNRTALLVALAVLFVLSVFAYGAVRKVQLDRATAAAHASQVAAEQAQRQASDKAFKDAESAYNIEKGKAVTACAALAQYAAAPATKKLVAYPPVCNIQ